MFRRRRVTIIRHPGTAAEHRLDAQGEVQPKLGFFPVRTDIEEGDLVEVPDPRAGRDVRRYPVQKVDIYEGAGALSHIEVTWGPPPAPPRPAPKPLALGDLHEQVVEAAAALYRDGHYSQAVFEAFKAVERRVRDITKLEETGSTLISSAFGGKPPKAPLFTLTERSGQMGRDEQEGRTLMLMGTMRAVRNLGAHELEGMERASAIELLGLASQMMRWLDDAVMIL